MSRLIDADELIETLAVVAKKFAKTEMQQNLMGRVFYIIEHKPTAYNVDKVVKQLEGRKCNKPTYFIPLGKNLAFDEAIEIVKAGGKE